MSGSDDDGWVFDSLVNFLHGAIWKLPVMGFIEEKSVVFDPDSYNNMTDEKEEEFRKIHDEYKALVDYMLTSFMEDLQVSPEQVEESCRMREQNNKSQPESHITKVALEQLWAAEDFNAFRRLMTRKNIDLQLQSLELLVAKYGVLSPALRPPNSDPDDPSDPNGEEDFLQVVIRCCPPPPPTPSPPPLHSPSPPSACQILAQKFQRSASFDQGPIPPKPVLKASVSVPKGIIVQDRPSVASSQIMQQDEQMGQLPTTPVDDNVKTFPPTEETPEEDPAAVEKQEEAEEATAISTTALEARNELDEETEAEIANQAPEQHRILTAVRRALDTAPTEGGEASAGSPKLELPTVGSDEEIERRREYLRAQRDKLVALKKREREKQLNNFDRRGKSPSGQGRPKSAKAAQIALKSPESITSQTDRTLQARRALAQRLKQELVE